MSTITPTNAETAVTFRIDENGRHIAEVPLTKGPRVLMWSADFDRLQACGINYRDWFLSENPMTRSVAVRIPSVSPRLPMLLVSRVILGALPHEIVQYDGGSFDLRRSAIRLIDRQSVSARRVAAVEGGAVS
jgi:hypothetical protein